MSLDSSADADTETYGEILGKYFSVVVKIGAILDESGIPRPEQQDRYDRLCEQKTELRERLAEIEKDQDPTDIKSILDEALKSD